MDVIQCVGIDTALWSNSPQLVGTVPMLAGADPMCQHDTPVLAHCAMCRHNCNNSITTQSSLMKLSVIVEPCQIATTHNTGLLTPKFYTII